MFEIRKVYTIRLRKDMGMRKSISLCNYVALHSYTVKKKLRRLLLKGQCGNDIHNIYITYT